MEEKIVLAAIGSGAIFLCRMVVVGLVISGLVVSRVGSELRSMVFAQLAGARDGSNPVDKADQLEMLLVGREF